MEALLPIAFAGKHSEAIQVPCVLQRGFVIYPEEATRPPTADEFYEIARKNKKRAAQK